jgi:uncharacterized protein GlcG (DUF336 family)
MVVLSAQPAASQERWDVGVAVHVDAGDDPGIFVRAGASQIVTYAAASLAEALS